MFLVTSLTACTADAKTRSAVDNLLDLGFGLVVPSVIETEQGTKVHTLTLGPSNLFLIEGDEGVVLVDAGIPALERIVLAYLDYRGIAHENLKLVYITHAHPDHYGSAAKLSDVTDADIAVHEDDVATMEEGKFELGMVRDWEWTSEMTDPTIKRIPALLNSTTPDEDLVHGERLDKYGIDGYVVHTPGHTPGSSVLMLEDRYAFVGDLVSNVGDPHAQETYADSWIKLAASLKYVQSLEPELIFAGHGPDPMSAEEFQALQPSFGGE